ncbi:putative leucine-rich repeat receptor-like serine/threonine-protein kinase At2g14440 [Cannabis sativa]|uniref:putative leucine-rich repeat receptor-like serine/threonine-protein kinase At2g14440 n=1 Tax=Cannabis sativa TaxID=3483 RepID=UPI0029CA3786|nr:putative leucine-rich repeat receptor-like serine/threonine-protein kinase At2g14440 [Cannabis sativa]
MASLFFFFLLSFFSLLPFSLSEPKGVAIDCGAVADSVFEGRRWISDESYVTGGISKNVTVPVMVPILSTVRSFPLANNLHNKFCYTIRAYRGARYMVRSTYFYGGINGRDSPPVFDQILDGTLWTVVNTTTDYANGVSTYYEGVFLAQANVMTFCIGVNTYTDSDPFISSLEFIILGDSLYNSTDFQNYGLHLTTRNSFGYNGPPIRYPDDEFDRIWVPFGENNHTLAAKNVSVSGFWNLPPLKVFQTELTSDPTQPLEFNWPLLSLPEAKYYIALYFADGSNSSENSRVMNISINGVPYYRDLKVTKAGVAVFASRWPLHGTTKISLTSSAGSNLGPLVNAGEVLALLPIEGRTVTRDVIALKKLKDSLKNPPPGWNGDPCLPRQYTWIGITCSEGPRFRVLTLNLTGMDLSGTVPSGISGMTALNGIWLGNNRLSGPIPDLSPLKRLDILHLEDNQFIGEIPSSLGLIDNLRELFLQNNNLTGQIPSSLNGKPGLDLRVTGNQLSSPPPT